MPPRALDRLTLDRDGAQLFRAAAADAVDAIFAALSNHASGGPGVRLHGVASLSPFLAIDGALGAVAASTTSGAAKPVRAILFDKTRTANWSLAWHQDRVIAVVERLEVDGFGPWSRKLGVLHVSPPFDALSRMVTLRLHLDPTPETNAPLLVALGSHRLGRVAEVDVAEVAHRHEIATCEAGVGDIWAYATPILHASETSRDPARRRVLQVDFADFGLPGGLRWLEPVVS
jgi:hypothetical protein